MLRGDLLAFQTHELENCASIVLYCTLVYCTLQHCIVLYYTVLYYTVLYCIVLYCTILYGIVLYYTVLYCTTMYESPTVNVTDTKPDIKLISLPEVPRKFPRKKYFNSLSTNFRKHTFLLAGTKFGVYV